MIIKKYVLGVCQTNCYLLIDENSKECAIIDPGCASELIDKEIEDNSYAVKYIFFTHGHFDHIGGMPYYMNKYNKALVLMHKKDIDAIVAGYDVFNLNVENPLKYVKQIALQNNYDVFPLGDMDLTILHTPGHTKGGVCIYAGNVLFSGDTLFESSIGRTDFVDGDFKELKKSVLGLYMLPDDTVVYPGHGDATTIGDEKNGNLYVRA